MKRLILSLLVTGMFWGSGYGQVEDTAWPMFRHDPYHSGRSLGVGPFRLSPDWALITSDRIYASPSLGTD